MTMFLCSIPLISALFSACTPAPPFATGYVEGDYVLIAPVTTAQVESLTVRRGDAVTAGQVLVAMERRDSEIAVAQAEAIIDAGVLSFMHWMVQRDPVHGVVPLIQQLNAQADEWRAAEIARARKRLAKGEDLDAVLEALSRGLTQKMLHGAMAELHSGDPAHREQTTQAISRLFLRSQGNNRH